MQKPFIMEHANGGKGHLIIEPILTDEEKQDKIRLYARVTIPSGCSMGYHTHHGDGESYYVISGEGLYTGDGVSRKVGPGDSTFCPDGHSHSIENTGSTDLVIMGLIIYSK